MSVKFEDRPLEKVREETIDQLVMNYGHGELSSEAFERRLDAAMDATQRKKRETAQRVKLPDRTGRSYTSASVCRERSARLGGERLAPEPHIMY